MLKRMRKMKETGALLSLLFFGLVALCGASTSTATDTTVQDLGHEAGNQHFGTGQIKLQGRQLQTDDQTCSNGLPGYEASNVCCPLSCGTCGGAGCSQLGEGCCTSDVKDSGDLCSETKAAPCNIDDGVVLDDQTCSNGLPGYEASHVCCPLSCGTCGGVGCSQLGEGCCTSDVKDSGDFCSETKAAPCNIDDDIFVDGPTCEGGILGIQKGDTCCPVICGECGGSGCSGRDGGDFSGGDACCVRGVASLNRICSNTVGAPCVIMDVGPPTCEGGIEGIQASDVCCPLSCGECGGSGCSSRNGGELFSGREACCGGGVRSLDRICSEEVGAPCVVPDDFASTSISWVYEGTEFEMRETSEWGAIMSFEIPHFDGEVAQLFFSKDTPRFEAVQVGTELYRVAYDSNGNATDLVLEGSEGRRSLQSEEQEEGYHLPAWLDPGDVENVELLTCSDCGFLVASACDTGVGEAHACDGLVKLAGTLGTKNGAFAVGVQLAIEIACNTLTGWLCGEWGKDFCAKAFCCGDSPCGTTELLGSRQCFDKETEKCCADGSKINTVFTDVSGLFITRENCCEEGVAENCCGLERCGSDLDSDGMPKCFAAGLQKCCPATTTQPSEVVPSSECCANEVKCGLRDAVCHDPSVSRCCDRVIFGTVVPIGECCPNEGQCGGECFDPGVEECCVVDIGAACPTVSDNRVLMELVDVQGRNLQNGGKMVDVQGRNLQDGGPTCEGGIPGIQQSDVCCPTSCGTCAGVGCSSRDGGEIFSGAEACCGGGVRSLDRICSDTIGAPCVVPEGPTCEGGIPGIQQSDVCCPTSCGTCAGEGCSSRDGGEIFSGAEACCGGGIRSLDRTCSDTVGAPCVVPRDFASTSTSWVYQGTEIEMRETAEWGAIVSFEIPDFDGEVAQFFVSKNTRRVEEIQVGDELYHVTYDSNGNATDLALEGSEGRRSLHSEEEDYHLPAWLDPEAVEGVTYDKLGLIKCSYCETMLGSVCSGIASMPCDAAGIALIVGGSVTLGTSTAAGLALKFLCNLGVNTVCSKSAAFVCNDIFCCDGSGCGTGGLLSTGTCFNKETEKCCDDGSIIKAETVFKDVFSGSTRTRENCCEEDLTDRCCGAERCGSDLNSDGKPHCFVSGFQKCCLATATHPSMVINPIDCCSHEKQCGNRATQCFDPAVSKCCDDGVLADVVSIDECCFFEDDCDGECVDSAVKKCCIVEAGATCQEEDEEDEEKRGGSVDGDPHMVFYDGLGYDCHGQGEFVLTKAAATDSEVQVRFQQWSQNPSPSVTVTTGVAAREGDSPVIQVTPATSGGLETLVDGQLYDDAAGTVTGVTLDATTSRVEMRFPSGLDVIVSFRLDGILRVNTYVPLDLSTTGLLGNNNGKIGDDWKTADGGAVEFASPGDPSVVEGTDFCTTNWCTVPTSSMFTYAEGEDHGTFDLCDAPYSGPVLPEVIPPEITQMCGDSANCIFDALFASYEVGLATLEGEDAARAYQEEVGGLCPSNFFSSTGRPPSCTPCPAGEVSATGSTTCTRQELMGLNIPEDIAAAIVQDAAGGFAGPGSLSGAPTGLIFLTDTDGGAVSVSGTFTRDDSAVLPSSTSVFFYLAGFLQPDFVRGQGTLDSSTGEFTADVTDIPVGFSPLFLSFVVTDPAEALASGADTVFPLLVLSANCVLPPLTISLSWFGADSDSDVDLIVAEPGGTVVDSVSRFGDVGNLTDYSSRNGTRGEIYAVSTRLGADSGPVLGDYTAHVNLRDGSNVAYFLNAFVYTEAVWFESGNLTTSAPTSSDFTVTLPAYPSTCRSSE